MNRPVAERYFADNLLCSHSSECVVLLEDYEMIEAYTDEVEVERDKLLKWVESVREWINDIEEQDGSNISATIAQSQDEALTGIFKEAEALLTRIKAKGDRQ